MSPAGLEEIAREIRRRIVINAHRSSTPHLGSCLSCVDILVSAYFHGLRIPPEAPDDPGRDRFVLSKGHGAPALFQVLALRGFFPEARLGEYGGEGAIFAEHPPLPGQVPGVEAATGSLGHGLPIALGMALAARIRRLPYRVVALLGDGECNEGSVWEAAMTAAAQRLGHLMVIVDYNRWQATGRSDEVLALAPLAEKWRAFGWRVVEIDGHDMAALAGIWRLLPDAAGARRPVAVIARTVKGKGVTFMEDDNNWHYRIPTGEELEAALAELDGGAGG
ncbi:MAG: transketolase [Zetaproteobacteria bacterium]|nr:MAG: transketolase [Zetaproteobacteria bacterium]